MSHIPNSAMPHAGPSNGDDNQEKGRSGFFSDAAGQIAEKVRENPKTAIAAGAAVVAGAVAAAAIPLVRSRGTGEKSSKGASKSGSKKS